MKHVLILGNPATYLEYLDFGNARYSCLLHKSAYQRLPNHLRSLFANLEPLPFDIRAMDACIYDQHYQEIEDAVLRVNAIAKIDAVFGNDEHILIAACRLRGRMGLPGVTVSEAEPFRNKLSMKRRLAGTGIPVPRFLPTSAFSKEELKGLLASCPDGVVLKPVAQAASVGVVTSRKWDELEMAYEHSTGEINAEEFISGDIYQIDGVVCDGELRFLSCAKYLNPPMCWESKGAPLGAVTVDESGLQAQVVDFSAQVVRAFGIKNSVFHLEAFYRSGEFIFLEIASRPGGAGTQRALSMAYGVNLLEASVHMELGKSVQLPLSGLMSGSQVVAGYLLIPPPMKAPHMVTGYEMKFEDCEGLIVESELVPFGATFFVHPIPYHSPASFIFRGSNSAAIEMTMKLIVQSVHILVKPIRRAEE